ncbi:MAG: tRNA (guanine(37)-N1)-methyltransferase Trm5b [Promethearchaeota archaeon]
MTAKVVEVRKTCAQRVLKLLRRLEQLDFTRKVQREGDRVRVPVSSELPSEVWEKVRKADATAKFVDVELPLAAKRKATPTALLEAVVPAELRPHLPHSFDVVGDLVVFELPDRLVDHFETHLRSMGNELLRAFNNAKAVYLKAGSVQGTFRTRPLRHLAGEERTTTVHRENGCSFRVDLAKTFFTPRLVTERARITGRVRAWPVPVVDLFAGVGSFSVQLAKHCNVEVVAMDVNPAAVDLCRQNAAANKVSDLVHVFHEDAKNAVGLVQGLTDVWGAPKHVVMNLPESALQFLDVAFDLASPAGGEVHLYSFGEKPDPVDDVLAKVRDLIESASGGEKGNDWDVQAAKVVKPHSPSKDMVVVDLRVGPYDND